MEAVSSLTIDIQSGLSAVLQSKRKMFPQHINRISSLDEPCIRKLYYMRHDWDKAILPDDRFQGILESGKKLEPLIEQIVLEVGMASTPKWRIIGKQMPTNDKLLKQYQISGTIDGLLQVEIDDVWITVGVVDIKTSDPNVYRSLNSYDSLTKYSWTRGYRGQLMLYALAHNLDHCYLLFVNKSNLYEMKFIDFGLDMNYLEELLEKAKSVNEAIETESVPDKINDPDECPNCRFFSFCCPDITTGRDLQVCNNEELEAILNQLDELKPTAKQYDELEKQRDALLVKGQDISCGKWLITWKKTIINYKAKEASVSESWRKTIIKT